MRLSLPEPVVIIRQEREGMFEKRHPWVFSGAVRAVRNDPADGDIVVLRGESGVFLARGYWNSQSQIAVHVLTWDEDEAIDEAFWRKRIERAVAARHVENTRHQTGTPNAYRLINAENDGIPGLVVDRYGDWLVLQALTFGIDRRKAELTAYLSDLLSPAGIYERSDVDVRGKEGLPSSVGVLAGSPPPDLIEIDENGRRFLVDVLNGHKTGFYLDQRKNRAQLGNWLSADADIHGKTDLNCFSYTGGFSVYALGSGARQAISLDASAAALSLAKRNVELNGFRATDDDFLVGDAFELLRQFRTAGRQFDVIVLDPPKFAQNQRQVAAAARGYKDINLLAFQLLKPGGMLMTFSCSGLVDADLFQKIVFGALVDSGREAQILARLTAAEDHPVALTFPEGMYLKGFWCRVW